MPSLLSDFSVFYSFIRSFLFLFISQFKYCTFEMISFFKFWQNSPVKLPEHGAFLDCSIFITVIISQICSLFLGSVLVIYMSIENHVTSSFSSILGVLPQSCFLFQVFTCPPLFFLAVAHVCTHRKILDFLLNKKNILCVFFWDPRMALRLWRSGEDVLSLKRAARAAFFPVTAQQECGSRASRSSSLS